MRRKKNIKIKNKKLVLLGLLLVFAIGYALLAVTLNINGFTAFKGQKWKIYWDNAETVNGSVDGSATIVGEKKTSVVVNAEFDALEQYYEFTIDAVNDGDFNAMIDVITTDFYKVENEEDISIDKPDFIICEYKYIDGRPIQLGDTLAKQSSRKYVIRISTVDEVDSVDDLPEPMELKAVVSIGYKQSAKGSVTLKPGPYINNLMYNLAYDAYKDEIEYPTLYTANDDVDDWHSSNVDKVKGYIEYVKHATPEQYAEIKDSLTNYNLISLSTTDPDENIKEFATNAAIEKDEVNAPPVYMWFDKDSKTIYYYGEVETIYMNEDSSDMFFAMISVRSIDLSEFNTISVENMRNMFRGCEDLEYLDLSNFDTSNVTDMSHMFENCTDFEGLNLNNFDTSKVTDMNSMFLHCEYIRSLDLSSFDTSNVTDMSWMFYYCDDLENLKIGNFNTSKVTNMEAMFNCCSEIQELNLSSFDTSNVTNMEEMFYGCYNLKTIYVSDLWSIAKVTESDYMFSGCNKLVGGMSTKYSDTYTDDIYARIDTYDTPGYLTKYGYYPVLFNAMGGTVNENSRYVAYGSQLGNLPTTTHGNNEFIGWFTAISGGEEVDSTFVPTEYTVIYARWKYEIEFDPNTGSVDETSRNVYSGVPLGSLPTPTREGYGFVGWYTGLTDGVKIGTGTIPTDSVTYYAHWEPLKVITYKSTDGLFNNKHHHNSDFSNSSLNNFYSELYSLGLDKKNFSDNNIIMVK